MRHPTTLKRTAAVLNITLRQITTALRDAGYIRRDPYSDRWRATDAGLASGMVVEGVGSFLHPELGTHQQYPRLQVTAEGRRWLNRNADAA